jgi:hypothetical protein
MKVVVPKDCHRCIPKLADEAQTLQRLATAVDQVTDQPKPILRTIEIDLIQQSPERGKAALQVTYGVSRQLSPSTESKKGGRAALWKSCDAYFDCATM